MEQQNYDDEISLRELILVLVRNWKLIIGCTAVFAVGMLIYLLVLASPVYQSELRGITNLHIVSTKYGDYDFSLSSPTDYLSVARGDGVLIKVMDAFDVGGTVEGFRGRIEINEVEDSGRISYTMTAGDPDEAKAMLEMMRDLTMESLETRYLKLAVDSFVKKHEFAISQLQDQIMSESKRIDAMNNELELIEPTVTLKKLAIADPTFAANLAEERGVQIESLTDEFLLEEEINPHYLFQEGLIVEAKNALYLIEAELEKSERYLSELKEKQEIIREYTTTGDATRYNEMDLRVFDNQIVFNEMASYPETKIAPRNGLNMAIAVVLGGMLGVFLAFFKAYWTEEI